MWFANLNIKIIQLAETTAKMLRDKTIYVVVLCEVFFYIWNTP